MAGTQDRTGQDLAGKVVLVTGASRGIGYAAAIEAARRGAHVVAVARTVGGLEELDDEIQDLGSAATLVPLDLRDGDAIDRLGAAIFERWGALDGLVANAGQLGVLSPLPHVKPEDFDKVMAVNVTANYRLLRATDLLLRQSTAGRAVFVSSSASRSAKPFWGLYAASKAALDALVKSYAGEVAQTKVRVNAFYPGAVRTAMRAKAMPGEDPETLPKPADIAPKLIDMLSPSLKENGKLFDVVTGAFEDI
ncbi:MAG: SDR family NAD(P)-dependent oxidoreductase [Devosia sp.]|jgi:NAD(P)-dependent dehydrogenase (short-subunit alcohol dehydrogenase family)|nr:SDR family NAD(P)-dependent oxidoreductase [Alphaproteobacteria bacterium]MBU1561737.1 SDR family NAD(P)-dependent oxidoreductase [Alphaproteobacteria bacterium]MBU2302989.1 SDR family NAD(P)-dependent oxidoreductase [Alphaproteobacteria bacterium]MBU2368775.1 SDR family NAD(P)-dependent oxidoreductase [Alphaproteobacteria bacterium]